MLDAFMLPVGDAAPGNARHRFALWHAPQGPLRSLLLYAHPFAEEMNKSRRMAALQARALAAHGHGVLQIDLLGCGDSPGDFGDATWAQWIDDLLHAARWLRQQHSSDVPLTLWGLRAGCLLQADVAAQWPEPCNFLFWQPAASGAAVLRQLLRQAAASAMLDGGGSGVVQRLQQQLAEGDAIEISGYRVHPALASGLEQARLLPPPHMGRVDHVDWLEVTAQSQGHGAAGVAHAGIAGDTSAGAWAGNSDGTRAVAAAVSAAVVPGVVPGVVSTVVPTLPPMVAPAVSPATQAAAAPWQAVARSLSLQAVQGPPFWQTAEIETAPQLLARTLACLDRHTRLLQPAAEAA